MGFGDSGAGIYGQMQYGGEIKKWNTRDWYSILAPLKSSGYNWDRDTHRMKRLGPKILAADTPWVHVKQACSKRCSVDHQVIWAYYNIIPPRCLNCWKVVVTPNSFKELMQLEEVEKKLDVPSKCGIELRDYTPKHYGGYFYNDSIDQGRECYDKVCDAVRDGINDKCAEGVILKRGCTEFEMINGPSPFWHITPEQEDFLRDLEHFVDMEHSVYGQQEIMKNHVRLKWALYAHSNNDMSYKEFNGDESLFPGYVKYHEGNILDIKRDLAVGQAQALTGLNSESTSEFLDMAVQFADDKDIPLDAVFNLGGNQSKSPLKWGRILTEVPEELKGDHDELT